MDTIDITGSGGESLIGAFSRDKNTRAIQWANQIGNEGYNSSSAEFISFCTDPVAAKSRGINSGYVIFNGTENISIKTLSTLSSAEYQIDIRFYQYENLLIQDGQLRVTRT